MKCEECGGTGKVQKWFYEKTGFGKYEKVCGDVKCVWCNGTGEVEQTEQEYIQTCTTEQLAEEVYKLVWCSNELFQQMECSGIDTKENDLKIVMRWLKQPHKDTK